MLFPFCCLRLEKFKVQKCLSKRIRAILRPRTWQKLRQAGTRSACSGIPVSAAEMVLTLELNLERDKTGDVGKFHDTYIIHISKFMITRDHTLLFPIHFRYKDRLAICCLTFSFSICILRQTGTRHF